MTGPRQHQRPRPQTRLHTAVRMALDRTELLRGPGLSPTAREVARRELAALTWLLELAGWPASRYAELGAPDALDALGELHAPDTDTNTRISTAGGPGPGTIPWEIGDIVGPAKHARRHHPLTFCLVRPNPGLLSPCVLYGRRVLSTGADRAGNGEQGVLAQTTTKITWPVEKIGKWRGPVAEITSPEPDPLGSELGDERPEPPERPATPSRFGPSEFAIGDYAEAIRDRKGKRDIQPALYQITRMGALGLVGRALYGRRVIRQTGEVTGPEIQITWRVRRATAPTPAVSGGDNVDRNQPQHDR